MEEIKSYDQIYSDMTKYIIAHQNELTDFNAGGVLTSQIEAWARELSLLYINTRVGFSSYLRSMPESVFDFQKKEGVKASTEVVFSRSKPFSYETSIPAGTVVEGGGLKYVTSQAGTVGAGQNSSGVIPALAEDIGDSYNIAAGEIKTVVSVLPADIISVNNPTPATGGKNVEDWNAFTARFNEFIIGLGRSSVSGVKSIALSVEGVRSVSLIEHFPALNGYNFTLYAEDGSASLPAALKAKVEEAVIGNAQTEGARACGVNARVLAPAKITVNPILVFRVDGIIPVGLIETDLNKKIVNYMNSLKIEQPYERKVIYDFAIHQPGVKDVISLTPDNVVPTASQIIRAGTITVDGE